MNKNSSVELQYKTLLKTIMDNGVSKTDRTGVGTKSIFSYTMRFNLAEEFPILTLKQVYFKSALHELIWMFVQGSSNTKYLEDNNVGIWKQWTVNQSIGNVYGPVIRSYQVGYGIEIDQLQECINLIKADPDSRRIVMTTWDPKTIADGKKTFQQNIDEDKGVLAPCHGTVIQFYVTDGRLNMFTHQRSCDTFLGLPFNIIGYATLCHMIAQVCNLEVGELIYSLGDAHIYNNHFEQVGLLLSREGLPPPTLKLNPDITNINDFKFEDFELMEYQFHPAIKAPIAI